MLSWIYEIPWQLVLIYTVQTMLMTHNRHFLLFSHIKPIDIFILNKALYENVFQAFSMRIFLKLRFIKGIFVSLKFLQIITGTVTTTISFVMCHIFLQRRAILGKVSMSTGVGDHKIRLVSKSSHWTCLWQLLHTEDLICCCSIVRGYWDHTRVWDSNCMKNFYYFLSNNINVH